MNSLKNMGVIEKNFDCFFFITGILWSENIFQSCRKHPKFAKFDWPSHTKTIFNLNNCGEKIRITTKLKSWSVFKWGAYYINLVADPLTPFAATDLFMSVTLLVLPSYRKPKGWIAMKIILVANILSVLGHNNHKVG